MGLSGGLVYNVKEGGVSAALLQAWPGLQEFGRRIFTELHIPARHFSGRLGHTGLRATVALLTSS